MMRRNYDTAWVRRRPWRWWLPGVGLVLGLTLLSATPRAQVDAPPPGFSVLTLPVGQAQALDGDTFEADLDRDGRITLPRERVRLLFVDTPELSDSHKGQDTAHGLPALAFLRQRLAAGPATLWVPMDEATGKYGRTLALLQVAGEAVNLALVRAGHSYFDTRFRYPPDPAAYAAFARAEAEAYTARRGIWGDETSRMRYLQRLRHELKTPAAPDNPYYLPGVRQAADWEPARALGRYVRLEGRLAGVRTVGKGVRLLGLEDGAGGTFPVVAFRRVAERLGVDAWPAGSPLWVEGFVKTWQGRPELVLHYGTLTP